MNNLQPYEKHLADKLHQVPVPDKNEGWIEMRKLLDRDMPEGGGGWSGNRKWWWMGITVAIIIAGLWTSQQFNEKQQIAAQPGNTTVNESRLNESSGSTNEEQNLVSANNEVNSAQNKKSSTIENANTENNAIIKNNSASPNKRSEKMEVKPDAKDLGKAPVNTDIVSRENENDKIQNNNIVVAHNAAQVTTSTHKHSLSNKPGINNSVSQSKNLPFLPAKNDSKGMVSNVLNAGSATDNPRATAGGINVYKSPEENAFVSAYIAPENLTEQTFHTPGDEFENFPAEKQPLKAEPGKTDKAFAKEMRKKSMPEDNRRMSKRSMRGIGLEKDQNLTFAAGLSIPQSFAIGTQQSPSYGVNAKQGKASDYIPVPFFQYHVNNRLFLQTELQFQSPQLTDRLLISQTQHQMSPAVGMLEKNVYVEKLYYFNIPINVYFSPARNFYIGSGIQYSSLLSGVATYQDNRYVNGSLQNSSSRVQGFKDDSVAAKLAPSEFRYQLEGNYYFNRFTFGARYNQALKQFVNVQPSPTLPFTQGRNKSFLIYLRYNIWEERKKTMHSLAGGW